VTSEVELVLQVICRAFSLPIFFSENEKENYVVGGLGNAVKVFGKNTTYN